MIEDVFYSALAAEATAAVSAVCEMPEHRFSAGYKRKKRGLIRAYRRAQRKHTELSYTPPRPLTKLKYLLLAVILASVLVFSGFIVMFVSKGFEGKVYSDNTHLFAVNIDGAPETIVKDYALSVIPEGFELCDTYNSYFYHTKHYWDKNGRRLSFTQNIKKYFNTHLNTEGFELVGTKIGGCSAVYIDFSEEGMPSAHIIWDSEDYILELSGDLSLDEMTDIAEKNIAAGFIEIIISEAKEK